MLDLEYHLLDVFTDQPFGGNQLAVFPDVTALPDRLMQRIARELNLSETVFITAVSAPAATHRMRIFTPGMELPFAGHPTVGTAALLASLRQPAGDGPVALLLEQGAGLVPVQVTRTPGGLWEAWLTAPRLPETRPIELGLDDLARLLHLTADDLTPEPAGPRAISAGVPFTLIPLRSVEALSRARLDTARWKVGLDGGWAPHVYCFALDGQVNDHRIRARMFAPAMGIEEDPATGAGAVALAGYLQRVYPSASRASWTIAQGTEIGRPSTLLLEIDQPNGAMREIRLGGMSVMMGRGTLRLPVDPALTA